MSHPGGTEPAHHRRGSLWGTVKAVGWSFFGVRRSKDYEDDVAKLNPLHLIAVGLLACGVFVAGLIALVHWVVR